MKISTILFWVGAFLLSYWISWLFYRYILRPDYRWEQKGNVCYEDSYAYCGIFTVIAWILGVILYHQIKNGHLILG